MRTLAIAIVAILMAASGFSQWIQLGSDIDGEAEGDRSGEAVSLSADGSIAAIGARWNHGTGDLSGHVRIFQWDGTGWIQRGNDIDGEVAWDRSGEELSLSADGNIVAISASEHGDSGHVRIFHWNGTGWIQRGSDIDGEAADDDSGYSVSLSDDGGIVAIGAVENDGNGNKSGHVRIHQWNTTEWVQLGNDIDGEAAEDSSGWSVSLSSDGNIVAIGAAGNDDNGTSSGHVRIFQWTATEWIQRGSDIDGEAGANNSGYSVSLSDDGNIVAIGAPGNGENGQISGHVRIYQWVGSADGSDGVPASPLPGYEIVHEPVAVEIAEDTGLLSAFLEGFEAEVVKATPLCAGGQWQFNRPGNGVAVRHYVVEDMDLAESGLGIGAYIKANFTSGDSTLPHHNLLWVGSQIDHDGNSSSRRKAFKIRGWTTGGGYGAPFDFDVSNAANPVTFRLDTDGSFKWIKSGQTNWAASTVDYDGPDGSAATGVVPDGWSVYMAYAAKNSTTEEIYPSPLNVIHENCNGTIGFDGDILRTISTDNGATWTPAAPVNTNATTDCGDDQGGLLVIDGNGDYIATWCSYDNLDCTIDSGRDVLFARSTDNCATWSAPAHLNSNATTDGPDDCITALVSDGQGNLIAVWVSDDNLNDTIGDDFDILLSFSNDNGITWSPAAKLNFNADTDSGAGPDSGRDGDPDLATDGSGNWVAVWRSNDDTLLNTIGDDYDILAATIFYVPVGLSSFSLEEIPLRHGVFVRANASLSEKRCQIASARLIICLCG